MHMFNIKSFLVAAGAAQVVTAHTLFSNFFVNGVDQGDGTAVRMTNIMQQSTFPIKSIESGDMACGELHLVFPFDGERMLTIS